MKTIFIALMSLAALPSASAQAQSASDRPCNVATSQCPTPEYLSVREGYPSRRWVVRNGTPFRDIGLYGSPLAPAVKGVPEAVPLALGYDHAMRRVRLGTLGLVVSSIVTMLPDVPMEVRAAASGAGLGFSLYMFQHTRDAERHLEETLQVYNTAPIR